MGTLGGLLFLGGIGIMILGTVGVVHGLIIWDLPNAGLSLLLALVGAELVIGAMFILE